MEIDTNSNFQPNFQAKVSERFVNSMRRYAINNENRLQMNYLLNNKIAEYDSFGFDNYTVEMYQKRGAFGSVYNLVAVDNKKPEKRGRIIATAYTYKKIVERFLNINREKFAKLIKNGKSI